MDENKKHQSQSLKDWFLLRFNLKYKSTKTLIIKVLPRVGTINLNIDLPQLVNGIVTVTRADNEANPINIGDGILVVL